MTQVRALAQTLHQLHVQLYKVVKSSQLLTKITVYFMICGSFSPEQSFCSDASEKMAK